jgi:aryl-alcohol dehydrogenase-like predicted oxidoreductase
MEYRFLGRTGIKVSPICLRSDDFGDATPPDVAAKIINRALALTDQHCSKELSL